MFLVMTPVNLAILATVLDLSFALFYVCYTLELANFVYLVFFMSIAYCGSFVGILVFHMAWLWNLKPGSYWYDNYNYLAMLTQFLAPFYIIQSGILSLGMGIFYLISTMDLMSTAWVIVGATFIGPIFLIVLLEVIVCRPASVKEA